MSRSDRTPVSPSDRSAYSEQVSPFTVLAIAIASAFMAILAASSANVALPAIGDALGLKVTVLHWIVTAYMIAFMVAIPAAGWLADRRGARPVMLGSLGLFGIGSLICALAPTSEMLIAGRIVQGFGASAIMPVSMILVTAAFPPERRGRALGIWLVGAVVGPIVGPTVGGLLVEYATWHWVFGMNVPLAALVLAYAAMKLPAKAERDTSSKFDALGFGLLAGGGIASVVALAELRGESLPPAVHVAIGVAGVVLLALFGWRQMHAENPLFPREVLQDGKIRAALTLTVVRSVAMFGPIFLLPVMLQEVMGYGAKDTGLLIAVGAIAVGVCSPVAGRAIDKMGPRKPAMVGVVLLAISMWAWHDLGPQSTIWTIVWPQIIRGFGLSLLINALTVTVLNRSPEGRSGGGASVLSLTNQLSGAVAIAALNALVALGLHQAGLVDTDLTGSIAAAKAFDAAFVVSGVICAFGLVPAFWLPSRLETATSHES
jgi:DHA2 family multidrug resistance protein